jgi:hypothetical protein
LEGRSALSIFAVVKASFNASAQYAVWSYSFGTGYSTDILHGGYSSNQVLQINNGTDSGFQEIGGTFGTLFLNEYAFDGSLSGNTNRLKKLDNATNKTLTYDSPGVPATTPTSATNVLQIGSYVSAPGFTLLGEICELLVVSGPVSGQLQSVIQGNHAHKWGLVPNFPATHPFRNRPPLIGD